MKKVLIFGCIFCLLLTGCGSNSNSGTLTCTKTEYDEDGYETTDTMIVNYKNDKVATVTQTNVSKMDADMIDFTLSLSQVFAASLSEIEGLTVEYSKLDESTLQYVVSVDYNKIDVNNVKDVLGDAFDETQKSMYTNNVSLEEFRTDILDSYTCK